MLFSFRIIYHYIFLFHTISLIWILKVAGALTHDCSWSSIFLEGKVLTYSQRWKKSNPFLGSASEAKYFLRYSVFEKCAKCMIMSVLRLKCTLWPLTIVNYIVKIRNRPSVKTNGKVYFGLVLGQMINIFNRTLSPNHKS